MTQARTDEKMRLAELVLWDQHKVFIHIGSMYHMATMRISFTNIVTVHTINR